MAASTEQRFCRQRSCVAPSWTLCCDGGGGRVVPLVPLVLMKTPLLYQKDWQMAQLFVRRRQIGPLPPGGGSIGGWFTFTIDGIVLVFGFCVLFFVAIRGNADLKPNLSHCLNCFSASGGSWNF